MSFTNSFTDEQLKLLGFQSREIWEKHRKLLGHLDGESFEVFFQRKHGYPSNKHEEEKSKKDLTKNEIILARMEKDLKQYNDKFIAGIKDLINTMDKTIRMCITYVKDNEKENNERFKVIEKKLKITSL